MRSHLKRETLIEMILEIEEIEGMAQIEEVPEEEEVEIEEALEEGSQDIMESKKGKIMEVGME